MESALPKTGIELKKCMHNVNLNIHYSAPTEVWDKLQKIYIEMPYWKGGLGGSTRWESEEGYYIEASMEPSGLQFFVDCGSNLEEIKCPLCSAILDFGWWGESMEKAGENEFADLTVTLPCCGQNSTLHKLEYHFPCGFARAEFVIRNPEKELSDGAVKQIEELAGLPVQVIHSHI